MSRLQRSLKNVVVSGVILASGFFMLGGGMVEPAVVSAQQSNQSLQEQIQILLERIAGLQDQLEDRGSVSTGRQCTSTMLSTNLGVGSQSVAVRDLQRFLNGDPSTRVAAAGAGSVGSETIYFGPLTAQAVSAFQAKYRSQVLTPLGLASPTGYWGASSRAQAQALCRLQPAPTPDDDDDNGRDDDDEQTDNLHGGEASLENFDLSRGDDSRLEEGEEAAVADIEFDVEDGDVRLSRVDVSFVHTGDDGDDEPWDVFEEVMLMHDGDEIASMDVSDDSDWSDDGSSYSGDLDGDEKFTVRFSGLDLVIREDDTAELTLVVAAQNNVDDVDEDVSWGIFVPDNGIRAIDGEGIQNLIGDEDDTVEFDIQEAGEDEELRVRGSSQDPNSSTIQIERNRSTGDFGIFAFDVEADDNDIELDTVELRLDFMGNIDNSSTVAAEYDDVVADAYIEIDGEEFDVDDVTSFDVDDDSSYAELTFDIDGDVTIDADDEETVVLYLEFRGSDGNYQPGVEVRGSIEDGSIEGEGADDVESDGSVRGEWHTLLAEGLFAYDGETDTDTAGSNDTTGIFEFNFTLEAFEDDFFVNDDGSDFEFSVDGPSGASFSDSVSLRIPGASRSGDYFRIDEGEEESVRLTVSVDPNQSGLYSVQLDELSYYTDTSESNERTYRFVPRNDFETDSEQINN